MKTLLAVLSMMTVLSAGAHPGHEKPKKAAVVRGERAQKIFDSLDTEVKFIERARVSIEAKRVGPLRCVKRQRKVEGAELQYRCSMRGKIIKRGRRKVQKPSTLEK